MLVRKRFDKQNVFCLLDLYRDRVSKPWGSDHKSLGTFGLSPGFWNGEEHPRIGGK